MSSTTIQWRVQIRAARGKKWNNRGLFETRAAAREDAIERRQWDYVAGRGWHGWGFGNTRVVRYEKAGRHV